MPQLRDSGNHSTAPLDAHTKDEIQSFARIFGIETEYGVSVTGSDRVFSRLLVTHVIVKQGCCPVFIIE